MKGLYLDCQEEALTRIVEAVSGVNRKYLRGRSRIYSIAIPRSILGYMLRYDVGCTAKRVGDLVGRSHSSVLKYVTDHDKNYKYFPGYKKMYIKIRDAFIVEFRGESINVIQKQLNELQNQMDVIKEQKQLNLNINQKKAIK